MSQEIKQMTDEEYWIELERLSKGTLNWLAMGPARQALLLNLLLEIRKEIKQK